MVARSSTVALYLCCDTLAKAPTVLIGPSHVVAGDGIDI